MSFSGAEILSLSQGAVDCKFVLRHQETVIACDSSLGERIGDMLHWFVFGMCERGAGSSMIKNHLNTLSTILTDEFGAEMNVSRVDTWYDAMMLKLHIGFVIDVRHDFNTTVSVSPLLQVFNNFQKHSDVLV